MSYYDFDDHFWSPEQVCGQKPSSDSETELGLPEKIFVYIKQLWWRENQPTASEEMKKSKLNVTFGE